MYWQNRFERENPDEKLEKEILDIRKVHKDYGYRRIWGELRNRNIFVNKKKVQRIVQKLNLQVTSFFISSEERKLTEVSSPRTEMLMILSQKTV